MHLLCKHMYINEFNILDYLPTSENRYDLY